MSTINLLQRFAMASKVAHDAVTMATVARHWDKQTSSSRPARTRWWESRTILRHINRIICGEPLDGPSTGFHLLLRQLRPDGYRRGVSVGCGAGLKEASLVSSGLVHEFFLYEISTERVQQGKAFAAAHGIQDRMHFIEEDALACCDGEFEIVYWNNALHHMLDVAEAISWSHARLSADGVFAMDDYVGASRFQWSDYSLEMATRFRESLSEQHLGKMPARVPRPSVQKLIELDPSEAADSERILSALEETFANLKFIPTGGAIYHPALNDVLSNIEEDSEVLSMALLLDEVLARQGETHYAVAIATR